MDQHESKRPRLSTGTWTAGTPHHGVSLPHPGQPITTASHHPHPPPPPPVQYQSSPHSSHPPPHHFPRPQDPHPPPPPPQHFDDRRQHEPERYPHMQEPHQPPPSPAHPAYPNSGYQPPGGRDPFVKRDPEDNNTLPQLRHPNTTGNGPEQLPPGPPHGHLPPQAHLDEKRQMSYDGGQAPPPMYRPPNYPSAPQTPMPHHGQYEPPMYGAPQDGGYPIAYVSAGGKRKAQRASQACDSCRQLKAKCDEQKPCKSCLDKRIECVYREAAPKQQDKATQDVLDAVATLKTETSARFADLENNVKTWVQEAIVKVMNPGLALQAPIPRAPAVSNQVARIRDTSPPFLPADEAASPPDDMHTDNINTDAEPVLLDREDLYDKLRRRDQAEEDDLDEAPGQPVQAEKPAFPQDHTTPAGRLLQWPSINEIAGPFIRAAGVQYPEVYPQRQELRRGQLPLFGRGEGSDYRHADRDNVIDHGDIPDDVSVGDHASPSGGVDWGPIGGPSPPATSSHDRNGTLRSTDETLNFEWHQVWTYVDNYKNHIQNMHPLIPPQELHALVAGFLEDIGVRKHPKPAQVAKFVVQQDSSPAPVPLDGDRKRKRTGTSPVPNGVEHGQPPSKRHKPQRSIQHALVLLVLALGKVCGVRDRKLPDVPEAREVPTTQGSPVVRNGHISSPNQGSPPSGSLSQSSGLPSPKEHERPGGVQSRRSSVQGANMPGPTSAASPAAPKKNYEVIPGLDYFAYATDVLGNQMDGTKLDHIHAHILACLYYGQLGRVVASFYHIRQASHLVIDKLLPRMHKFKLGEIVQGDRDNKLIFAFWSCLQLETDILAELNLSSSTILNYESILTFPNVANATESMGFSPKVIASYSAQLYLRKKLNEIHGLLYNPAEPWNPNQSQVPSQNYELSYIESTLFNHNSWLSQEFHFGWDDEPSSDILAARIRGKFFGAANITYRPFIREVLEFSYNRKHMLSVPPQPSGQPDVIGNYRSGVDVPSVPVDAKTPGEIPAEVIECARKGIHALIQSTRSFHALEDVRFVITNVFGTAHAQWGNLITLAAIYQDPILGVYVDEAQLRELFRRTIDFFKIVAQDTSSLVIDLKILEGLQANLPSKQQLHSDARASTSFSNGSSYTPVGPAPFAPPGPEMPLDRVNGQPTPMEM